MKSLKLIAVLMEYPQAELWDHSAELYSTVGELEELSSSQRAGLSSFIGELLALDPMQAQERWLELFERGRAMSLLLFEHIHGESRDRGQAMVDLVETYRKNGLELAAKQLPDYLPLVLEYLSMRPEAEVQDWLKHIGHILELLAARAQERESAYAVLFTTLVEIAQGKVDLAMMRRRVSGEARDDTPEAMDKVWEEEVVRFGAEAPAENCDPPNRLPTGAQRNDARVMP